MGTGTSLSVSFSVFYRPFLPSTLRKLFFQYSSPFPFFYKFLPLHNKMIQGLYQVSDLSHHTDTDGQKLVEFLRRSTDYNRGEMFVPLVSNLFDSLNGTQFPISVINSGSVGLKVQKSEKR